MSPVVGVFTVGRQIDFNGMSFPVFETFAVRELHRLAVMRLAIVNHGQGVSDK